MKKLLSLTICSLFLASGLFFVSCQKEEKAAEAPTTGQAAEEAAGYGATKAEEAVESGKEKAKEAAAGYGEKAKEAAAGYGK